MKLLKGWIADYRHFKANGGFGKDGWLLLFLSIFMCIVIPALWLWATQ